MEIQNFYTTIPQGSNNVNVDYKNYEKMKINLNSRYLIVGCGGAGKTNVLLNLLKNFNCFTKYYLYVKQPEEPLYAKFISFINAIEKKTKTPILEVYTNLDTLEEPEAWLDKEEKNCIIFDDMLMDKKLEEKAGHIWIRARKLMATCFFLSQSYFKTPSIIRLNSDYIIIKKLATLGDLSRILREYNFQDITKEKMLQIYNYATKDMKHFLLIDLNNPTEKFRLNFTPIKMQ